MTQRRKPLGEVEAAILEALWESRATLFARLAATGPVAVEADPA